MLLVSSVQRRQERPRYEFTNDTVPPDSDPLPQPLMSLLFGRLTQDFVSFETTLNAINAGDTDALSSLPEVQAGFKRSAALDASYLVYIGV